MASENAELKRLCLYLDEQRQALIAHISSGGETEEEQQLQHTVADEGNGDDDEDAELPRCESSRDSTDSALPRNNPSSNNNNSSKLAAHIMDERQEGAIRRMLADATMQTSTIVSKAAANSDVISDAGRAGSGDHHQQQHLLLDYIHSLETRVRQLELNGGRCRLPIIGESGAEREEASRSSLWSPAAANCFASPSFLLMPPPNLNEFTQALSQYSSNNGSGAIWNGDNKRNPPIDAVNNCNSVLVRENCKNLIDDFSRKPYVILQQSDLE